MLCKTKTNKWNKWKVVPELDQSVGGRTAEEIGDSRGSERVAITTLALPKSKHNEILETHVYVISLT